MFSFQQQGASMLYEVWQAHGEADGSGYWALWHPVIKMSLKDAKGYAKGLALTEGFPTEVRIEYKVVRHYDSTGKRADKIFSSYEEEIMCS